MRPLLTPLATKVDSADDKGALVLALDAVGSSAEEEGRVKREVATKGSCTRETIAPSDPLASPSTVHAAGANDEALQSDASSPQTEGLDVDAFHRCFNLPIDFVPLNPYRFMRDIRESVGVMARWLFCNGQVLGDFNIQSKCVDGAFEVVTMSPASLYLLCHFLSLDPTPFLCCLFFSWLGIFMPCC